MSGVGQRGSIPGDPLAGADEPWEELSPGEGTPGISILMPIFRQQDFVVEALESVFGQRKVVAEILVSDDASPDATAEVARDWIVRRVTEAPCPHRVRFRRGLRRLRRDHLTLLVESASSDLVMQAHGDDLSHPDRAWILAGVFRRLPKVSLATSHSEAYRDDGSGPGGLPTGGPVRDFESRIMGFKEILEGAESLTGFAVAWRRHRMAVFPRLDSRHAPASHDRILAFRAGLVGEVAEVDAPLVVRRTHAGSWSQRMVQNKSEAMQRFGWNFLRWVAFDAMTRDLLHFQTQRPASRDALAPVRKLLATGASQCRRAFLEEHRRLVAAGKRLGWFND